MRARELANRLSPETQDRLRALADRVVPARRRGVDAKRSATRSDNALASKVSPDGGVLQGPFVGLRLPEETAWIGQALYLSGTYEHEVGPAIEAAIALSPSVVVDIGAADGYYAAGLARRLPSAEVHAFDIDPQAQRATRAAAKTNGLNNVLVHGRVTHENLAAIVTPGCLVVSDCEGYEVELLDPAKVPGLRTAHLIVETHDVIVRGASASIEQRFAGTHDVSIVPQQTVDPTALRHLAHLTADEVATVTDEGRLGAPGAIHWLVMTPRR